MKSGVGLAALVAAAAFLGLPQKSFATVIDVVSIVSPAGVSTQDAFDNFSADLAANGGSLSGLTLSDSVSLAELQAGAGVDFFAVIDRNDGNLNELTLQGTYFNVSAPAGVTVPQSGGFLDQVFSVAYNDGLTIGLRYGVDGLPFTADDIVLDPSTDSSVNNSTEYDFLVLAITGYRLADLVGLDTVDLTDDTPDELTISIEARGGIFNILRFGNGSGSIAVTVPEPASFALLAAGSLLLTRRR